MQDVASVGGKTASLGEMTRHLVPLGVRVPDGFGVTAEAYWHFIERNRIKDLIHDVLSGVDLTNGANLQAAGSQIRQAFMNGRVPKDLADEITSSYRTLIQGVPQNGVAVRSSATAEDLPTASFAGQQETYLNVHSEEMLLLSCKQCFASLFTDRAISYRNHRGFDHFDVALSICVQLMVRSDMAASGVMFSIDTETGFRNAVLINSSYGLGENVVQGAVNPDEFYVFKPTLNEGKRPILQKHLGSKEMKLRYDVGGSKMVKNVPVPLADRRRFSISDDDILELARWAVAIENHYSELAGKLTPMDMEWAKDGMTGDLFIVQARPETTHSQKTKDFKVKLFKLKEKGQVLTKGRSVGEKIAAGRVRVIKDIHDLDKLHAGDILVTDKTDPDWEPAMKQTAAIVTNRGGRTCHAAIVSRELGLPAIVGTENGTDVLQDGQDVTVSCAEGEVGYIYSGILDYEETEVDTHELQERPQTQVMTILANPEEAFRISMLPNDGVGLARVEFIINHAIRIHPMALIHFDQVTDEEARRKIEQLTSGYESKSAYFVDKLAQGVAMLAAAFYPKDVILRFSDFKTNEYANLIGGRVFELVEDNPMIGFRGASRYYNDRYRDGFALECRAIKTVRETMGLTNLKVMIPFCRTLTEAQKVLAVMADNGLKRGENGLSVYVMCEIPSNVVLASQFAELFDGFSIGSNDLTQLTLGVDRDSELLSEIFDERNDAVMQMIRSVIAQAKQANSKIGICGQAPSDYPEFAEFLVAEGIDSISLNPDTLVQATIRIKDIEAKRKMNS
jgi:pyruvate,water dikinase